MANYASLKAAIQEVIKTNGNNEITGSLLQQSLLSMINSLGVGYQYAGIATPSMNPGTPDQNVFYIASTEGTYTNFGGVVLENGEIAILKYNGAWSKDSTGAASLESVEQLGQYVDMSLMEISTLTYTDSDFQLENGYIKVDGTETTSAGFRKTQFIPVEEGEEITILGQFDSSTPLAIAGYSGRNIADFVSGTKMNSAIRTTRYKVPETVKYVKLCFSAVYLGTYRIEMTGDNSLEKRMNAKIELVKESQAYKKNAITTVLEDGIVGPNGAISEGDYKHTMMLPIIDGYGYYINIAPYRCSAFSAPRFDEESYIGVKNGNVVISDNTKFISFSFANNADLSNLQIISLKDVKDSFENLFIEPQKWYYLNYSSATLDALYAFMSGCVKDMCFKGGAVSYNGNYLLQIRAFESSNTIRFIIKNGADTVNDSVFIDNGNGVFEGTNGDANYNLSVKLDYGAVGNSQMLIAEAESFILKKEVLNRHRVRRIPVNSEIVDYSDYFTAIKGAVAGYIMSTTGAYAGATSVDYIATDYIPTAGLLFVKATIPSGTTAGLAFYDRNKVALSDYQGTGKAGFSYTTDGASNIDVFKEIPANAAYFRVTGEVSNNNKKIVVVRQVEIPEYASNANNAIKLAPRASRVIWDYKNFDGMGSASRVTLSQDTFNEDARQIKSKFYQFINDEKFEVSFLAGANCFIGIGIEQYIMSEVRVQGNQFTIKCGGSPFDTYIEIPPVVVFTYTLPFTVTSGKMYKLGIKKRDAYKIGNVFYSDATFFVDDFAGNYYEKTIPRNAPAVDYNNVSGRYIAACLGKPFVSLKQGSAIITNISLNSDYAARAKVMITGDSFVDGDTMVDDGEQYKYASLLQQAIGQDVFVLNGRGGGGVDEEWLVYFKELVKVFCPEYVIIALGTNNRTYSTYLSVMNLAIAWLDSVGVKPILVTVTPVKVGSDTDARSTFRMAANAWVRNSGRLYVDINKAVTTDADGAVWNPAYVRADGVHPTVAGHQAIYEAFLREVPEIFNV